MSAPPATPEPPAHLAPPDDPMVKGWERFFKKHMREAINEAVLGWPTRRSVVVDWFLLDAHDSTLAQHLLDAPLQALAHAEEALKSVDVPVDPRPRLHVRVQRLPVTSTIDVRDLRAEHLGKLVSIKGLIKKVTEVRPKLQDAVFQCGRCGAFMREPQEEHLVLKEPLECYEDQGGCGRDSTFKLIVSEVRGEKSRFVDTQKIEIQEAPETMRGGEQPQRLHLFAEDDLCGIIRPGERVTVTGILRCNVRKDHGVKSTLFEIFLEANSIDRHEQELEEIDTTPEEEDEFRRFVRESDAFVKMRDSIAPTLHGLWTEKEVLLLQLFGGVEKRLPDKTRLRGDIHVLLVGDPGVAKSQLIRFMSSLAPRGIYTSGKASSGPGLTATAVQDDFGEGRWTLEAGAMVLADRGLLCVDELDKMDKKDQSAMHEGMEQQTISIAKAGITATLHSRCAVLGAANPKQGRFEQFSPIGEQINFPPALLSRFDVIFVLQDHPHVERDGKLARHILDVHRGGAMLEQLRHEPDEDGAATRAQVEEALRAVAPPLSRDWLRKFVAYAKRTCHPVLTEEARDRLASYYVGLRRQAQGDENKAVPITARQLEALVRLSEASARSALRRAVTAEDAERAIRIYEAYMRRIGGEDGMDIDKIASGVSASQRQQVATVKQVIRDLEAGNDHGADYGEVVAACEKKMVPPEAVQKIVERLKGQGELYTPRENHLKLTGGSR